MEQSAYFYLNLFRFESFSKIRWYEGHFAVSILKAIWTLYRPCFSMSLSSLEQVTRGHNIVGDGWAGASNPQPHPNPTVSKYTFSSFHSEFYFRVYVSKLYIVCVYTLCVCVYVCVFLCVCVCAPV